MRPLLITPTQREARALGRPAIVCAGAGAAHAIPELRRTRPIDVLIIVGVCGGLDPSLAPGGIILARSVSTPDGPELAPDPRVFDAVRRAMRARNTPFVSSRLLTVDRPAVSRAEKTALWNTHGAAGVDMETHDLAAAAAQSGIPWLAVRAVLDPIGSALPAPLRVWRAESDERDILGAIVRRPWEWPAVARLAWRMRAACRALRAALDVAIPAVESVEVASMPNAAIGEDPPVVATLNPR